MPRKKQHSLRVQLQPVVKKPSGDPVGIHLPKGTTKAEVNSFKTLAQALIKRERGVPLSLTPTQEKQLQTLNPIWKEKLKKFGIQFQEEDLKRYQLSEVINDYLKVKQLTDDTDLNKRKYELTGKRLILCFGKTKDVRELNQADGFKYQNFLVEKFNQRRDGTARRLCGYAHTIFKNAVKNGLLSISPFDDVPKNALPNPSRWFEITPEITQRIWNVINNEEDRVRFVCLRFLGLRCPSELNLLKWNHFDFQTKMVKIHSPKLKKTNKFIRYMPFDNPNVYPVIKKAYANRKNCYDNIVKPISQKCLRQRVEAWLGAAGLNLWPNLISNFRKTAVTEASREMPSQSVNAYFGHTEEVSQKHYRMVTEIDAAKFSSFPSILNMEDAA